MLTLVCFIVGEPGYLVSVDVDETDSVAFFKEKIRRSICHVMTHEWLFLARAEDGEWLRQDKVGSVELDHEDKPLGYAEMDPAARLKDRRYFGENFEPSKGEVHVVVVPADARGEHREIGEWETGTATKELQYYQQHGEAIHEHCQQYCTQVLDKIDEIAALDNPKPFICVHGSSGMGKSQLAFALYGRRPYYYLFAIDLGVCAQYIYKNFHSLNEEFHRYVTQDDPNGMPEQDVLDAGSGVYTRRRLATCGFVYALLKYARQDQCQVDKKMIHFDKKCTLSIKKRRCDEVRNVVAKMKANGILVPFFILDEATSEDSRMSENRNRMNASAFMRNVFRACGLVVIMMGTDPRIPLQYTGSQTSAAPVFYWTTLVPVFPKYQMLPAEEANPAWQALTSKHPSIRGLITHSRGRFARYFYEAVTEYVGSQTEVVLQDVLDEGCHEVCSRTSSGKGHMRRIFGKCTQMMAVSYASTVGTEQSPKRQRVQLDARSMHVHFANLIDTEVKNLYRSRKSLLAGEFGPKWDLELRLPSINEDILLYLSVLGGKDWSPYRDGATVYSARGIFKEVRLDDEDGSSGPAPDNWEEYELVIAHALFSASRQNGVAGIAFDDFVEGLLGEFQPSLWEKIPLYLDDDNGQGKVRVAPSTLLEGYGERVRELGEQRMPFLAPINATWPSFILGYNDHGCNFGRLILRANSKRPCLLLQSYTKEGPSTLLVCECKYRIESLDMQELAETLDTVCSQQSESWSVLLVFCKEMAKGFTWAYANATIGCVQISCGSGIVKWVHKPSGSSKEQLVIVVETAHENQRSAADNW